MQSGQTGTLKIYRVLVFKKSQDIGHLKILALNLSRAFKIARQILNQAGFQDRNFITLRALEIAEVKNQGQTERLLSRGGV